jgi:hypothetical protein
MIGQTTLGRVAGEIPTGSGVVATDIHMIEVLPPDAGGTLKIRQTMFPMDSGIAPNSGVPRQTDINVREVRTGLLRRRGLGTVTAIGRPAPGSVSSDPREGLVPLMVQTARDIAQTGALMVQPDRTGQGLLYNVGEMEPGQRILLARVGGGDNAIGYVETPGTRASDSPVTQALDALMNFRDSVQWNMSEPRESGLADLAQPPR